MTDTLMPAPRLDATPPDTTLFERLARDPSVDADKLDRLMALHERLTARRAEEQFNAAMSAAQADMRPVTADADNPQTKSRYASYAALDRALRPIYTRHGFALSFDTGDAPHELEVRVLCYVTHEGGHKRTYRLDMPADGKGAKGGDVMTRTHAVGAATSYGARYLLKAIFNVAVGEEDDDGNSATTPAPTPPAGFEDWRTNLEALADEGDRTRLAQAFAASRADYRAYVVKQYPEWTTTLKARRQAAAAGGVRNDDP